MTIQHAHANGKGYINHAEDSFESFSGYDFGQRVILAPGQIVRHALREARAGAALRIHGRPSSPAQRQIVRKLRAAGVL